MKKILLFLILLMPIVLAMPPQPDVLHQFYGNVNCDEGSLTANTLKTVLGSEELTTPITDGKYGYSPSFFVSKEDSNPETEIKFYIDDYEVSSYTYQAEERTNLDISVNPASCEITNNENNDNSGSGGSGGGGTPLNTNISEDVVEEIEESSISEISDTSNEEVSSNVREDNTEENQITGAVVGAGKVGSLKTILIALGLTAIFVLIYVKLYRNNYYFRYRTRRIKRLPRRLIRRFRRNRFKY